jgi:hypothetical protein
MLGKPKKGGGEESPPPFRLGQQPAGGRQRAAVASLPDNYLLKLKLEEGWKLELHEGG